MRKLALLICLCLAAPAALADIASALSDPSRSDKDKQMDALRKPGEVLRFMGIEPGMSVIDIFAGGGYYTEILSRAVGKDGFVTLYNNAPWDNFVGKAVDERLAGDRLPNVDRYTAPPESLADLPDQYDAGIFVLGMHDIYYEDQKDGWPAIDKEKFLKGIYKVIADGGVLLVIDHNAKPGTDPAVVSKSLHRIDPDVVIRDLTAAGFKLEARSDILRNPDDNLEVNVFDPSIRHHTDRSVLRFRK